MVTITRQTMELFLKEFHYVELVAMLNWWHCIPITSTLPRNKAQIQ